jgi:hypothetical protein
MYLHGRDVEEACQCKGVELLSAAHELGQLDLGV